MEASSGGPVERIIGMGKRVDPKTRDVHNVTHFYRSFYNEVLAAFEHYPIVKYFGITPEDAMAMPVDRWYRIRKISAKLAQADYEKPDPMVTLLQYLKDFTEALIGSGGA